MPDLNELLAQVMSNPQAMEQINALAQSLGLQGSPEPSSPPPPSSAPMPDGMPDATQLVGTLFQMSRSMGGDDRQVALIQALKPFVRPERAQKLERAIQIARISRLAGNALQGFSKNLTQGR